MLPFRSEIRNSPTQPTIKIFLSDESLDARIKKHLEHFKEIEDIEITEIGCKPGEKLYEELMSPEETRRTIELEQYFSVLPAFRGIYNDIDYSYHTTVSEDVSNPYVSEDETPLTVNEIKVFLRDNQLLGRPQDDTDHRYWPGDKEESK